MTNQQIFDKVAAHLLAQGKRSENSDTCLYRGPDGLMCAVGCLITDEAYGVGEFEGCAVADLHLNISPTEADLALRNALEKSGVGVNHGTIALLARLQQLHDKLPPAYWSENLKTIADDFGLDYD